jgi:hypothetical protein
MKLFGTICIDVSFLYTCLNLEMCDLELGCLQPELGTLNIVDVDVRRRLTTSAKPSVTLIRYIWRVDDGSLSTVYSCATHAFVLSRVCSEAPEAVRG